MAVEELQGHCAANKMNDPVASASDLNCTSKEHLAVTELSVMHRLQ